MSRFSFFQNPQFIGQLAAGDVDSYEDYIKEEIKKKDVPLTEKIVEIIKQAGPVEHQINAIAFLCETATTENMPDIKKALEVITNNGTDRVWCDLVRKGLKKAEIKAEASANELSSVLTLSAKEAPTKINPFIEPRKAAIAWGSWALHWFGNDASRVIDEALEIIDMKEKSYTKWFAPFCNAWGRCGFPAISISHKLAASLMATSIPEEYLEDISIPWNCFLIDIPNGIFGDGPCDIELFDQDDTNKRALLKITGLILIDVKSIVSETKEFDESKATKYMLLMMTTPGCIVGAWGFYSFAELLEPEILRQRADPEINLLPISKFPPEMLLMFGRLIIGALIELDSPERKAQIAAKPKKESKGTHRGNPSAWSFQLNRDVRVDARQWVKDYISSGGKAPSIRLLVRGHHKRQVCGAGRQNRKWIQIEPYWRGDEALPIGVRTHKIKE